MTVRPALSGFQASASCDSGPHLRRATRAERQLGASKRHHRSLAANPPDYAGGELGGYAVEVAALAALRGPDAVAGHFALVAPALPRVISQIGGTIDRDRVVPAFFTLAYCNAARCCGAPVPPGIEDAEQNWLAQLAEHALPATIRPFTTTYRHSLWTCRTGATTTGNAGSSK